MNVHDLIEKLDLTVINQGDLSRPVTGGYAGDLLSWVMGRAERDCAWFTIMSNQNVAAGALMADVACVVLTEGVVPDADLLRRAEEKEVNLLGTGEDTYTAACRFRGCLE